MADEAAEATHHPGEELLRVAEVVHAGEVSVTFKPGPTVLAKVGDKLLDIAEASQVPIESGCRMGMCGSDPVRVLEGGDNISAVRSAERRTLERLGLADGCRMACVSRVQGPVVVDPRSPLEEPSEAQADGKPTRTFAADPALQAAVRRVVVVGAGVAGVTAAEELRRVLPDTELLLVGAEPYDFYNRMAITRLVSESASIDSLYLNRRDWAESRRVDFRRGVPATEIDRQNREVATADGERLEYDKVIIATGARPFVPALEGFGADGSFVLRTIDDAVQIQQYIRRTRCGTAVIVGAGLLGLEAAYNIAQLDVRVLVLDRGRWPLRRQLDEQAGALVWEMLQDLGIELLAQTEAQRVHADDRVTGVELLDGTTLDAELCLVTAGIIPNAQLAEAAGLDVGVGITVDGGMRTSDPDIFAVGDVAEHDGRPFRSLAGVGGTGSGGCGERGRRRGRLRPRGISCEAQGARHRSALHRRSRRPAGRITNGRRERVRHAQLPQADSRARPLDRRDHSREPGALRRCDASRRDAAPSGIRARGAGEGKVGSLVAGGGR